MLRCFGEDWQWYCWFLWFGRQRCSRIRTVSLPSWRFSSVFEAECIFIQLFFQRLQTGIWETENRKTAGNDEKNRRTIVEDTNARPWQRDRNEQFGDRSKYLTVINRSEQLKIMCVHHFADPKQTEPERNLVKTSGQRKFRGRRGHGGIAQRRRRNGRVRLQKFCRQAARGTDWEGQK